MYNVARVKETNGTGCDLVLIKIRGFFLKNPERGPGRRVNFMKTKRVSLHIFLNRGGWTAG
jgi:hypothetical protein